MCQVKKAEKEVKEIFVVQINKKGENYETKRKNC